MLRTVDGLLLPGALLYASEADDEVVWARSKAPISTPPLNVVCWDPTLGTLTSRPVASHSNTSSFSSAIARVMGGLFRWMPTSLTRCE